MKQEELEKIGAQLKSHTHNAMCSYTGMPSGCTWSLPEGQKKLIFSTGDYIIVGVKGEIELNSISRLLERKKSEEEKLKREIQNLSKEKKRLEGILTSLRSNWLFRFLFC